MSKLSEELSKQSEPNVRIRTELCFSSVVFFLSMIASKKRVGTGTGSFHNVFDLKILGPKAFIYEKVEEFGRSSRMRRMSLGKRPLIKIAG